MLQIRNADEGKSEWNLSEAHIIIPMVDGDLICNKDTEKILTSGVTLNSLENCDQTVLTNGLEHSFIVGLDKNFFETTNCKSDLLIIQNSDLKVFPCNSDLKVAYALSNPEQEKNEILFQHSSVKDKNCTNEKAVFEVRHAMNYDDIDLEKNNRQLNLGSIRSDITSRGSKPEKEVSVEEMINQEKSNTGSQFFVNYNPDVENNKSVSFILNSEVFRTSEIIKSLDNKKLFQSEALADLNIAAPSYKLGEDIEESILVANNHIVSCSDLSKFSGAGHSKFKTDEKEKITTEKNDIIKDFKLNGGKWEGEISSFVPEKDLPLKKKAKMKRTLQAENSVNQKSLLENDIIPPQENLNLPAKRKIKQINSSSEEKEDLVNSDSGSVKTKIKNQTKVKLKNTNKKSPVKETKKNLEKTELPVGDEAGNKKLITLDFDDTKFSNIFDLVEYLHKCSIINASLWQTLNSGLKEIKVDILKEMIANMKANTSPNSSNYSPQLKAFALVLHFTQPSAFIYLAQMFKNGWPSLNVLKEWKQRMNALRWHNFIREQSEIENSKF